ncbi:MAG TPA: GNAT family N-acetyltransferase [Rhodothermales bacterium]|nr:GNAT family N-acetyltransferase [Rhodothermales bacterium]
MSFTIRRARAADADAVRALWEALHREHEATDARYRLSEDAALRWASDLREWTRSDADRVLVAEQEGELVGLTVAHLMWPAPVYASHLMVWVDDFFVLSAHRGQGIGRALLDALRAWGREKGAEEIRAGVLATNPGARRFWAGAGGVDYSVTVTLGLDPADT